MRVALPLGTALGIGEWATGDEVVFRRQIEHMQQGQRAASASCAMEHASASPVRDAGEKSTGHSRCVNGRLDAVSADGGTTSTGQPAFLRTSSVTEPSKQALEAGCCRENP